MTETQHPALPLKRDKERVVQALIDHYAADDMTVEEFEARLDGAYAATTTTQLECLLADLPALAPATGELQVPSVRRAPVEAARASGLQLAVLGGYEKKGTWMPPRKMVSVAIMASAGLDFTEAKLAPGVTEVRVLPFMGYVEVVVPPGLAVETRGFGLLGGFEGVDQEGVDTSPDAPRLVIRGMAVMGYVEVSVRLPGETARDAKRRRHTMRRQRRRQQLDRGSDE